MNMICSSNEAFIDIGEIEGRVGFEHSIRVENKFRSRDKAGSRRQEGHRRGRKRPTGRPATRRARELLPSGGEPGTRAAPRWASKMRLHQRQSYMHSWPDLLLSSKPSLKVHRLVGALSRDHAIPLFLWVRSDQIVWKIFNKIISLIISLDFRNLIHFMYILYCT